MANEAETRIVKRISAAELERRWQALRRAMKASHLDFLIFQNSAPSYGGYVRWLTDVPVHSNPVTVIFPADDEMTLISHGPRPPAEPGPAAWSLRGVKKRFNTPIIHSMEYTCTYQAELVVAELASHKDCRVGLVGMGFFSAAFYKYVVEHLTAKMEGATELADNIRALKSDEEISLTRETCRMHDALFEHALTCIRPGRRDWEVRADILSRFLQMGGEEGSVSVGSAPPGTACNQRSRYFGNRTIEAGDQVTMLIETAGPGGLWGEFSRTVCLGEIPPQLQEQYELARQAQKVTLDLLKPGADPVDLWNANNGFLRGIGYPEERRIYAHAQGYDMMERPSLNPGETMKIQARMNIAVHPEVKSPKAFGWVCENYLVSETGGPECLHHTPQKIHVI